MKLDLQTKQHLASFSVGLLIFGVFYRFLDQEMAGPIAHPLHVKIFAGGMAVGTFFMMPTLFLTLLSKLVVIVPWSGKWGTRNEDTPIIKAPEGTKPGDPVVPKPTPKEGDE